MSGAQLTPEVLWAQRSSSSDPDRNYVYLTIVAPDVPASSLKVDLKPTSLSFTGFSETKKNTYAVTLEFFAEIDVDASKTNHSARDVEFKLQKKDLKEEYWPRLLKESKKMHFLKTDFDKWVDEDEQDGAPDDEVGGMGGMPDMSAMGGDGGFGGIDFSKLGGGAGGMPDMGDLGGEEDDEVDGDEEADDSEMPGLEEDGAEGGEGKGKGKEGEAPKIEEVA